jgi:seryl-tRNA(Sec) selenium transferase
MNPMGKPLSNALYDHDLHAWAQEQASLLRAGRLADADIDNIAEEIDALARSERRELTNRLIVLLTHLLTWDAQPERRGRSWLMTIRAQRRQVVRVLAQNPSLRPLLDDVLADAYGDAILVAAREMDRDDESLPAIVPWTFDRIVGGDLLLDHELGKTPTA